jgi:hypothetical protein
LSNAYFDFVEAAQSAKPDDPKYQAAASKLASLCEQLGWKREAEAWRRVLPEG